MYDEYHVTNCIKSKLCTCVHVHVPRLVNTK